MINIYVFALFAFILAGSFCDVTSENDDANACTPGQVVRVECNICRCINGNLACTKKRCLAGRSHHNRNERSPDDSELPKACTDGQTKKLDCNHCFCSNGNWACTLKGCIKNFGDLHRQKRGVPVAADLKNTPCAPNDYFKIDCNTCYCNIDKTGYLCTQNLCSYSDSNDKSYSTEQPKSTDDYPLTTNPYASTISSKSENEIDFNVSETSESDFNTFLTSTNNPFIYSDTNENSTDSYLLIPITNYNINSTNDD